jgi:hypothetical protein
VIAAVITELARNADCWHDLLRLVDSTPLPCAASRETVKRSDLAGHCGYGLCASHSRYFWGFRLYLIRPDRKDEPARFGKLARCRQWIEAVFDTLKGQLTLEEHGGRTLAGVYSRVAARLLALATSIWHNWHIGAPVKRSLIAYDS